MTRIQHFSHSGQRRESIPSDPQACARCAILLRGLLHTPSILNHRQLPPRLSSNRPLPPTGLLIARAKAKHYHGPHIPRQGFHSDDATSLVPRCLGMENPHLQSIYAHDPRLILNPMRQESRTTPQEPSTKLRTGLLPPSFISNSANRSCGTE